MHMSNIRGPQWFSNEEFEVRLVSRDDVLYKSHAREVYIQYDFERDTDEYIKIWISWVDKWNDGTMITNPERAILNSHLTEAFAALGIHMKLA
jgi:hypothetical protein